MELLLRKAEEWDKYASRDVTLKAETMRLRALVVRWRKMELYTWPKALKTVEDKYQLSGMNCILPLVVCAAHSTRLAAAQCRRTSATCGRCTRRCRASCDISASWESSRRVSTSLRRSHNISQPASLRDNTTRNRICTTSTHDYTHC